MELSIYFLSTALAFSLTMAVYHGMRFRNHRYPYAAALVVRHKRWAKITAGIMIVLVAVIEKIVVPRFRLHDSLLFRIHLCLCACYFLAFIATFLLNGNAMQERGCSRVHRMLGRLSWISGILVVITGDILTSQLRS